ncbi:LysR family transcriptional regulator, glycine cleavage system transcriptional activator [Roseateles sp. YR242]|uniref:LysR family transcriptional regulator n=1 Tax=Roseateles sp. YR242 TaxID=1855305 RepID=UPI0008B3915A|nr:LysR family transcriptional regulator [Roseateles sp. YR242]SEL49504.1 LysR family transcriptional regulator, glycine cleavage system transcriptional activator [Roseateles sp. YR242]
MNTQRQRPLAIGPLRAFEAVARRLSFSAAAEELFLTQSAVSRQIRALEEELGATLFHRGTRHVALTADGQLLQSTVSTLLERLDGTVRQIRQSRGRRVVNVTTFASFASLWLIPRLEAFQRDHPDMDIRVSAHDQLVDLEDSEIDIALRYCQPRGVPPSAQRLFGEVLTPVVSPWMAGQAAAGQVPPLNTAADLRLHTLAEEDDQRPSGLFLSWRRWLAERGQPEMQPRRWMYLNFTYQQVQAAVSGQAVALARLPLVADALQRGELAEPFGAAGRIGAPTVYWLMLSHQGRARPEVMEFARWISGQAALTRQAIGESEPAPAQD